MPYILRPATQADAAFLWQMLYLAAHMADGNEPFASIYDHPELAKYVRNWPRANERGLIAADSTSGALAGAAWLRFFPEGERDYGFIDAQTPELAIAVEPAHQGQGVATLLLQQLLAEAQTRYPAVGLTVREGNPALRLYERAGFQTVSQVVNRVGTLSFLMVKRFNEQAGPML